MEINKYEDVGLVDVWLSREDQTSQEVQDRLRELYCRCKEEKYTVAVFYSGQQDLAEETSALLRYNRRRFAERAVQWENTRKRQASR